MRPGIADLSLGSLFGGAGLLAGLFVLSTYHYLLFHAIVEISSVAMAWSVFFLGWNTRRLAADDALAFLGVVCLFTGFIDLLHTLTYKGMGLFSADLSANRATQLWIAARGFNAVGLFLFPFLMDRRIRLQFTLWACGLVTALLLAAIFVWGLFPDCYIEGLGLTPFKKGAEYAVCFTLVAAMVALGRRHERTDPALFRLMLASMAVAIAAELAFTFYISVYGLSNVIGHLLKLVSFSLAYMALVRSTVTQPFTTIFRDLTRERETLRIAEETYRGMFLNSQIGLFRTDLRSGRLLDANDTVARFIGYENREALLISPFNIAERYVDPEDRRKMVSILETRGEFQNFETRFRRNDGSILWMRYSARLVPDKGWIEGVSEDITERKRNEAERVRLAAAIGQTAEAVVMTDVEGRILYVNPAFEHITGYSREEVLGQTPRILKSGRQDAGFYRAMWDTLLRGDTWRGQFVNRKKDGTLYTEETIISPVRDDGGQITHFVAVKHDTTEEDALRRQLQQSQKVESIGRLAGGVAHDLNNLLSPILGYGEMLRDTFSPGDHRRVSVDHILGAGRRARDLVRQLLAFSRKQTLEMRTIEINAVIRTFANLLRRTIREDISMAFALSPEPLPVLGDIGQLEQVLMNLAVNAADAMPGGGGLTIATARLRVDEGPAKTWTDLTPGDHCLLTFTDTGCGMDEETAEKVFEPFFSTKGDLGTGLGLATVYGIVKQHGGNIRVASAPGQGAAFEVFLPLSREAAVSEAPEERRSGEGKGSETILLVEDNDQVRDMTKHMLEEKGYSVLVAADGAGALELLTGHRGPIHLLLTDVIMPGMNGKALFGRVSETHPNTKVLYMSGYTSDVVVRHGALEPGARLIGKPFRIEDLAFTVRDVLDRNQEGVPAGD